MAAEEPTRGSAGNDRTTGGGERAANPRFCETPFSVVCGSRSRYESRGEHYGDGQPNWACEAFLRGGGPLGQVDPSGTRPKLLERIVIACFLVEQMHDQASVIEDNPTGLGVAFDAHAAITQAFFERVIDLLTHGMKLPATGARGNDEVVEDWGDATHVEDNDVRVDFTVSVAAGVVFVGRNVSGSVVATGSGPES